MRSIQLLLIALAVAEDAATSVPPQDRCTKLLLNRGAARAVPGMARRLGWRDSLQWLARLWRRGRLARRGRRCGRARVIHPHSCVG